MYSLKPLVLLLALLFTFATAIPTPHQPRQNRRRQCRGPATSSAAPTPSPTTTPEPAVLAPATTSTSSRRRQSPSPSPSPPPPSGGGGGSQATMLFPKGTGRRSWSTSPNAPNSRPLSDATLRPTRVMRALSHDYVNAPDGKRAMKAHYPAGSYAFRSQPLGGLSFYAPGPTDVDLTTAKEVTFGYSVFFPRGFAFNHGGKLPGIYGGNSEEEAVGCSGGRRDNACFSARLMWRDNGQGELYTYLPPSFAANQNVCNIKPQSDCNPTYGASVGRGSFSWPTGRWQVVSERVRLNDVGQTNGEIELFVNGRSVISAKGLVLRNSAAGRIRGIQMQTFFGGHSSFWASPRTQDAFFSDFSIAITQTL